LKIWGIEFIHLLMLPWLKEAKTAFAVPIKSWAGSLGQIHAPLHHMLHVEPSPPPAASGGPGYVSRCSLEVKSQPAEDFITRPVSHHLASHQTESSPFHAEIGQSFD
jgi:hypothetical protein